MTKLRLYKIHVLFFLFLFANFYLNIPLKFTGKVMWGAISLILIMILSIFNLDFKKNEALFLFLILFYLILYVFIPNINYSYSNLVSSFQFLLAFFCFIQLKKVFKKNCDIINYILPIFVFILFSLSVFETLGVTKTLSDSFRNIVYSHGGLYNSDYRDIALTGRVRPKVFASEPSMHVLFICICILCIKARKITDNKLYQGIYLAILLILFFITNSPTIILTLLLFFLIQKADAKLKLNPKVLFINFILMTVVLFSISQTEAFQKRINRFGQVHEVTSDNVRIIFPIITMIDVVKTHPVFGLGISNKDKVIEVSSIYKDLDYEHTHANLVLGTNAITKAIVFTGFAGFSFFCILFYKVFLDGKNINLHNFLLISTLIIFVLGAFEQVYFWILASLIYSSCMSNTSNTIGNSEIKTEQV